MSDQTITIEVDGQKLEAQPGQMLIEVTDAAGVDIPRFCYHDKLSVAANCRMCLVEVEKAPKPLPACATPVMDGMVVRTQSGQAREAQKGTMEFLLINHPLDCPICDQGGECELQDVAVGYGGDVSRFVERKRIVEDKDIGPLIATDLTRCIHCTRCVRFGAEIAGMREMGATGRGEHMTIGTYIEKSVDSEMSGNVIDVCPVGALTSKPFRYQARAWEMTQHSAIAPHDCVGSNLYLHSRRSSVQRAVPRDNDAVNECWISDRDRYSYAGINSSGRLTEPMMKVDGKWQAVAWDQAIAAASAALRDVDADKLGALAHPVSTIEELYLLQKMVRGLGSNNVDHRLHQVDFTDQNAMPAFPYLGQGIDELENVDAALVIGGNIRKDQPLLGHRLRKAALKGAKLMTVNPVNYDYTFDQYASLIVNPGEMQSALAGIAKALADDGASIASEWLDLLKGAQTDDGHKAIAVALKDAENATVLMGQLVDNHPNASALRALSAFIAEATGAKLGFTPAGGNGAGAWIAGCVPHRGANALSVDDAGKSVTDMLAGGMQTLVLMNIDPDRDFNMAASSLAAVRNTETVIALTAFDSDALRDSADILLPIAAFAETSGTWINAAGGWQGEGAAVPAPGEARPGWKVLRVLGGAAGVTGLEYIRSEAARDELDAMTRELESSSAVQPGPVNAAGEEAGLWRVGEVPMYSVDGVVRRSEPLQGTVDAVSACVLLSPSDAERLKLNEGDTVAVSQGSGSANLPVGIDYRLPEGSVWVPASVSGVEVLGAQIGPINVGGEG